MKKLYKYFKEQTGVIAYEEREHGKERLINQSRNWIIFNSCVKQLHKDQLY